MKLRTLLFACASLLSVSLVGCGAESPEDMLSEADLALASSDGALNATLTLSSSWNGGYCADVSLKNNSARATTTWGVTIGLGGSTFGNGWSGTFQSTNGTLSVTPVSYNTAIAAGATTSFGFCGSGSGRPTLTGVTQSGGSGTSTGTSTSTTTTTTTKTTTTSTTTSTTTTTTPPAGKKWVGNITTNGAVRSDFRTYWDQITPENEGKWASVEGTRDVMNWAGMDRVYNYAVANNIPVKGHTLVWGAQAPSWIAGLSQADQAAEIEEWIQQYCARYPKMQYIDAVNEPDHQKPSFMNALGGTGATGHDWIINAFKLARKHCPNAKLILNDYNVLRWETDKFIAIANKVKAAGLLDGVGCQSHGLETQSFAELQANLKKVVAIGVPVYISEYDVNIADDTQQKNVMQQQFTLFYNEPAIKGITLWGYIYGSTWIADSGLIRNGTQRPAMTWLRSFLGR